MRYQFDPEKPLSENVRTYAAVIAEVVDDGDRCGENDVLYLQKLAEEIEDLETRSTAEAERKNDFLQTIRIWQEREKLAILCREKGGDPWEHAKNFAIGTGRSAMIDEVVALFVKHYGEKSG